MKNFLSKIKLLSIITLGAGLFFSEGCDFKDKGPTEVRIDTEPTGASIAINGIDVGRTPYKIQEPAYGKYFIHLEKEGFSTVEKIIEITQQTPADIVTQLPKVQGIILFDSTPPGADLTINGVFRGKTPTLVTDLTAGVYKAAFSMEGHDKREMEVIVSDRIPKLANMAMKSIYATLKIQSDPTGALVMVDGIDKGKTPCVVDDILQGEHTLKLTKSGFKDYVEKINVSKIDETAITVPLAEVLASIEINSNPAEARVSLDNEFKGRTPVVLSGLRDGTYSVTVEKPGYEKVTKQVTIKNKEDAKLDVSLSSATGALVLNVLPVGSTVVVLNTDVKAVTGSGPFSADLPPGNYQVEVTKAGYERSKFPVDIELRKTFTKTINLMKIFVKDTVVLLKDGRTREGMIATKYPNGSIKLETAPGIFEDFKAEEIQSIESKQ